MSSRGYDLGDVAFGLTAETAGLDRALDTLRKFGQLTNEAAASTEKGSGRITAAMARQEKAIINTYTAVKNFNAEARKVNAPMGMLARSTNEMQAFANTMTKGAMSSLEYGRAVSIAKERVADLQRQLKSYQGNNAANDRMAQAINRAQVNMQRAMGSIATSGAPFDTLKLQKAFNDLEINIRKSGGRVHEINAAQREFNATLNETNEKTRAWQQGMRSIEVMQKQVNNAVGRQVRYGQRTDFPIQSNQLLNTARVATASGDFGKATLSLNALRSTLVSTEKGLAAASQRTEKFASAMRQFERSTILAVGPLSGVGARAAVVASMFETMSGKAVLATIATTGLVAGLGMLSAHAVRTVMAMEQWKSMLIAASGSQALVAEEMSYLTRVGNEYGQVLSTLIPSYAKFATSARLANVSLEEQRNIFEGFMTAGAAMHWNQEQLGRAFLALEQMMSKGVIQSQEMKLQMAQVLPGAMEIAAASVGKTTAEFMKMMENGEALTKDVLPKMAERLKEIFARAAEAGKKSLVAELARYENVKLEFGLSFDKATKSSEAFRGILSLTNDAITAISENMDQVIAVTAGVGAAFTVYLGVNAVQSLYRLTKAIKGAAIAQGFLNAATLANPWLIAGAALAGVTAYTLMNRKTNEALALAETQSAMHKEMIKDFEKAGSIQQRVQQESIKDLKEQNKILADQIRLKMLSYTVQPEKSDNAHARFTAGMEQDIERLRRSTTINMFPSERARVMARIDQLQKQLAGSRKNIVAQDPELARMQKTLDDNKELLKRYEAIPTIKEPKGGLGDSKAAKAAEAFANKMAAARDNILDTIDSLESLRQQQESMSKVGLIDLPAIEAAEKASKFIRDLERKDPKLVTAVYEAVKTKLRETGIESTSLVDGLTKLYEAEIRTKTSADAMKKAHEDLPGQLKDIYEAATTAAEKLNLAQLEFSGDEVSKRQYETSKKRYRELMKEADTFFEAMSNPAIDQEQSMQVHLKYNQTTDNLKGAYQLEDLMQMPRDVEQAFNEMSRIVSLNAAILEDQVGMGMLSSVEAEDRLRQTTLSLAMAYQERLLPMLENIREAYKEQPMILAQVDAWSAKLDTTIKKMAPKTTYDAVMEGLRRYKDSHVKTFEDITETTQQLAQDTEKMLADFLFNPFEEGLQGMLRSFVSILHRMASEALAAKIMESILGNVGGGGGSSNPIGGLLSGAFNFFAGPSSFTPFTGSAAAGMSNFSSASFDSISAFSTFFADGGIMTPKGPLKLNTYAGGGIADTPQMAVFGEGSMAEAYVPLPDGKSIPVKMDSGPKSEAMASPVRIVNMFDNGVISDYLSGSEGEKVIINAVRRNASAFRGILS